MQKYFVLNGVICFVKRIFYATVMSSLIYLGLPVEPTQGENNSAPDVAVERLYHQGMSYFRERQFDKAVEAFTAALKKGPYLFDLLLLRSSSYFELKQYDKGLEDASKAISIRPQNPLGYMMRAAIYARTNRFREGVDDLSRAIELNSTLGEAYRKRGAGYLLLGEPEKALSDLTTAITLGERDASVYKDRGFAYKRLGRYSDAIVDFSNSFEINPSDFSSILERGWLYRCLGEFEKAISDFNVILKAKPEDVEARLQRAGAYTEIDDFKAALADINYSIERRHEDPYMYLNLAEILYLSSNVRKALEANEKAMSFQDDHLKPTLYFQRGLLLLMDGQADAAQKTYFEAVEFAKKTLDLDALDDGIAELKNSTASHQSMKNVIDKIILQLVTARAEIARYAKPIQGRCHKLRV